MKQIKSKYFSSDNLIKILLGILIFVSVKVYDRLEYYGKKIIDNDRRITVNETKIDYIEDNIDSFKGNIKNLERTISMFYKQV